MKSNAKIFWFMIFHTKLWWVLNIFGFIRVTIITFSDEIDGFIRVSDGTKYLLFGAEKYYLIYNSFKYLIEVKSGITHVFSHNYAQIETDSFIWFIWFIWFSHWLFIKLWHSWSQFLIKIKITSSLINS